MAFCNARSYRDKVETCHSLARHTTDAKTLRALQSLIEEYSIAAATKSAADAAHEGNMGRDECR